MLVFTISLFQQSFIAGELNTSQKQAFIKLIVKKIEILDVCVKKNWIWQRFSKMDTNLNEKPGIVCLERGTRQGDPISAYLFILALEVVFSLIKANPDIEGLQFFSHTFLYSAYADDTNFF